MQTVSEAVHTASIILNLLELILLNRKKADAYLLLRLPLLEGRILVRDDGVHPRSQVDLCRSQLYRRLQPL